MNDVKKETYKEGCCQVQQLSFYMSTLHCIGIPLRCLVNALVCQTIKFLRAESKKGSG